MAGRGTDIRLGGPDEARRAEVAALGGPLRDRHEPAREPAHRPAAAGSRRPAGRPRLVALLREPRGPAHPALRRRAARVRAAPAAPGRTRRSRAASSGPRSRAPSGSSRTRASSSGARSSATPRSSRSSAGPSSAGARRCSSGAEPQHLLAERAARALRAPAAGRRPGGPRRGGAAAPPPRDRPLLERPPRGAAGDARGQRAPGLRRPLPARRVPPPGGGELPGPRGPDRGRGRRGTSSGSRSRPTGVDWEREGLRGPSATWTYLVGENPFGASGLAEPRRPHGDGGRGHGRAVARPAPRAGRLLGAPPPPEELSVASEASRPAILPAAWRCSSRTPGSS